MFDAFKAAGAIAGLMKNKEALLESGERVRARLGSLRVEGSSGGGAVRATVSGEMRVLDIRIEPALASGLGTDPATRAMAEALITEAVNNALDRAKSLAQAELAKEAEALGVGGLPGLGTLLGGAP